MKKYFVVTGFFMVLSGVLIMHRQLTAEGTKRASIAVAEFTVCAIMPSGGLKCWGNNNLGQLGIGKKKAPKQCCGFAFYTDVPLEAVGLSGGVKNVSAGIWHFCAVTGSGGVKCWGENFHGNLGTGSDKGPEQCPTTAGEVVECSTKPVDVKDLSSGVAQVSLGKAFSCALLESGGVKCWGLNMHGQLGSVKASVKWEGKVQYTKSFVPVAVEGLSGAKSIAAGSDHVCALLSSGGVKCWGMNAEGQLGNGDASGPEDCYGTPCSAKPVAVKGISNAVSIMAGHAHTCALLSDGAVKCWGTNTDSAIGVPMGSSPSTCDKTEEASYFDEGKQEEVTGHRCVFSSSPIEVKGVSNAKAVSSGSFSTCALTGDGKVRCWGYTGGSSVIEIEGLQDAGVKEISIGWSQSACMLLSSGKVKCFGNNVYNSLGDGKTESAPDAGMLKPVDVIQFP